MSDSLIQLGNAKAHYNVSHTRILKYSLEMYHKGLNEHKIISAPDIVMLENKANLQAQKWSDKWNVISNRRKIADEKETNFEEANKRTEDATKALKEIDNLLLHTLSIDDIADWDILKKKDKFSEKEPTKPAKKSYKECPTKPNKTAGEFTPAFTFWEKLISSKKEKKIQDYESRYLQAISK